MKNWKEFSVSPKTTILETMENIDRTGSQIALVINTNSELLGTVTDGDIRRGILQGISIQDSVERIMNSDPFVLREGVSNLEINRRFRETKFRQIPLINSDGIVLDLIFSDTVLDKASFDNEVVLMAGGLGTRLRPLTEHVPKPMLTVGTKPILQTILENFIDLGFHRFYLSVNFKKELIKNHFGNGLEWGVNIDYLEENQKLGTAGALSLFKAKPTRPIIVMNGDILTKINFNQLLEFHEENQSVATMCVREYQHQIPYGVVRTDGVNLRSIEEKPVESYFVNAGIYVLNPEVLDLIPNKQYYDMPSLFEQLIKENKKTSVFPIREYWLDIGRKNDFEKANADYSGLFEY